MDTKQTKNYKLLDKNLKEVRKKHWTMIKQRVEMEKIIDEFYMEPKVQLNEMMQRYNYMKNKYKRRELIHIPLIFGIVLGIVLPTIPWEMGKFGYSPDQLFEILNELLQLVQLTDSVIVMKKGILLLVSWGVLLLLFAFLTLCPIVILGGFVFEYMQLHYYENEYELCKLEKILRREIDDIKGGKKELKEICSPGIVESIQEVFGKRYGRGLLWILLAVGILTLQVPTFIIIIVIAVGTIFCGKD